RDLQGPIANVDHRNEQEQQHHRDGNSHREPPPPRPLRGFGRKCGVAEGSSGRMTCPPNEWFYGCPWASCKASRPEGSPVSTHSTPATPDTAAPYNGGCRSTSPASVSRWPPAVPYAIESAFARFRYRCTGCSQVIPIPPCNWRASSAAW